MNQVLGRQLPLLCVGVVHTVPWRTVLGGVGVVAGAVVVAQATKGAGATRGVLPLAAVCLAIAAGTAVGDDARDLMHASPTPWWVRGGLRVAAAVGVAVVGWLLLLGYVAAVTNLHADEWSVRLAALTAVTIAAALHWGSAAALPAALVTFAVAYRMPKRWLMVVGPDAPGFGAAQARWLTVLVLAGTAVCLLLRDPARPRGRGVSARRGRTRSAVR
jgi:hypothetical protein